ncbi:hypothetical protein AVEN_87826-1 [Araneus ventricosus]|uniref:Uncharacterized protein n=1 Tax=Araneus ventricosus TaxID=182803 RepID=A0A4Y2BAY3_ARAVE|nr:hypothetical protein AVEN_87826-1 [Araneus ventricosus]
MSACLYLSRHLGRIGSKACFTSSLQSFVPVTTSAARVASETFFEKNERLQRPLSPHLTIYKLQLTSVLSVTHRATGIVLSTGILENAIMDRKLQEEKEFELEKLNKEHELIKLKQELECGKIKLKQQQEFELEKLKINSELKLVRMQTQNQNQVLNLNNVNLTTLSPVQSSATKAAIINSKKKRKRVQHRAGEVMTEPNVIERLHEEELE